MIVVIPFCYKDADLAVRVIRWAIKLDGPVTYRALLVHDTEVCPDEVRTTAEQYFKRVDEFVCSVWPGRFKQWPFPQNHQFQETCNYIYGRKEHEPWFWWEPDATPLKPHWLRTLETEHLKGGKAYTGHIVGEPFGHMTGVGIYPWNVINYSRATLSATNIPWDLASKDEVVKHCHRANDLIQHIWEKDGQPFTFTSKAEAEQVIAPTAVIFHRCKDGSLMDVLNGKPVIQRIAESIGLTREAIKPSVSLLTLGRYGDICNTLPLSKWLTDTTGQKTGFIVSKECADILDGCSYVTPIVCDVRYSDVDGAITFARDKTNEIRVCQMYGNHAAQRRYSCFLKDAVAHVELLPWFGRLPLIFDERSATREERLAKQHLSTDRENILVNLTGLSSPFEKAGEVMADIQRRWSNHCHVVDIGTIKAERIYDLLGLYDRSAVLVTTDTATLHLARASAIKVAALLANTPDAWYGSDVPFWTSAIRYNEWPYRRELIHQTIADSLARKKSVFHHVFPDYAGTGDSARRNSLAALSWKAPYQSGRFRMIPVADEQLYRMWTKDKGKKFPFLKDVVEHAVATAADDDWILLTNTDTCFTPDLPERLDAGLVHKKCGYSYRRDFQRLDTLLNPHQIQTGHRYVGKDLFVFRKSWWSSRRNKMPDMIYGAEGWDALLSVLIDESKGAVFDDLIYHERHDSYWEKRENRYAVPSQIYCLALARQFCKDHNINPKQYGFL